MTCFTFTGSMSIVSFREEKKSAYKKKIQRINFLICKYQLAE